MEKRLRVFRTNWRIFLWRSEVIEVLKSLLAGISNETFTCKSQTFLVMFECFWENNTKIITGLIADLYYSNTDFSYSEQLLSPSDSGPSALTTL